MDEKVGEVWESVWSGIVEVRENESRRYWGGEMTGREVG